MLRFCLFVVAIILGVGYYTSLASQNIRIVKDFRHDWQYASINRDSLVLHVALEKYVPNHILLVVLPSQHIFWLDSVRIIPSSKNKTLTLSIDSLIKTNSQTFFQIIVVSDTLNRNLLSCQVIEKLYSYNQNEYRNEGQVRLRENSQNIMILFSVFTLLVLVFLRTLYFKNFNEFFGLINSLQLRQKFKNNGTSGVLNFTTLSFLLFYSLLLTTASINIHLFKGDSNFIIDKFTFDIWQISWTIIPLSFILILLKALLITIMGYLFDMKKIKKNHFYVYMRHSLIFVTILFLFGILNGILKGSILSEYYFVCTTLVIVGCIVRFLILFLVLNKIHKRRKFHLISYLCGTDVVPLLLFLSYLLK